MFERTVIEMLDPGTGAETNRIFKQAMAHIQKKIWESIYGPPPAPQAQISVDDLWPWADFQAGRQWNTDGANLDGLQVSQSQFLAKDWFKNG
jgi:hypothetical protein